MFESRHHCLDSQLKNLALCIAMLLPVTAYSIDAGEMTLRVLDTLTGEYATCAAYHGILSRAAAAAGESGAVARQNELRDKAIIFALTFARKGHGEQAARSVTTDRIDAAIVTLFGQIDGNTDAIPALSGSHATRCRHALENPGSFADEVLERTLEY